MLFLNVFKIFKRQFAKENLEERYLRESFRREATLHNVN